MEKYILDNIFFKVEESQQERFIELVKDWKEKLEENDLLPVKFSLFHDIDKDTETYTLYLGFNSDAEFDVWEAKVSKIPELANLRESEIFKFVKGYNYSEKVCL